MSDLFSAAAVEMPIFVKMTLSKHLKDVFEEFPNPQKKDSSFICSPQTSFVLCVFKDLFNLQKGK